MGPLQVAFAPLRWGALDRSSASTRDFSPVIFWGEGPFCLLGRAGWETRTPRPALGRPPHPSRPQPPPPPSGRLGGLGGSGGGRWISGRWPAQLRGRVGAGAPAPPARARGLGVPILPEARRAGPWGKHPPESHIRRQRCAPPNGWCLFNVVFLSPSPAPAPPASPLFLSNRSLFAIAGMVGGKREPAPERWAGSPRNQWQEECVESEARCAAPPWLFVYTRAQLRC